MRLRVYVCAVAFVGSTTAALALDPADKCEAAKNKIAGKYAFCRLKAEAKAIKTGDPVDYSKCDSTFGLKWGTAETKGGCPTTGDMGAQQAELTANANRTAWELSGEARFVDNGDGTIRDRQTSLVWEKLVNDGGVHDFTNLYNWTDALAVHVAALNGSNFAGHNDWRLPTLPELQTIVDFGDASAPVVYAPFDTACTPGCTAATCSCTNPGGVHWSSTVPAYAPAQACTVRFDIGDMSCGYGHGNPEYVRAVRTGP